MGNKCTAVDSMDRDIKEVERLSRQGSEDTQLSIMQADGTSGDGRARALSSSAKFLPKSNFGSRLATYATDDAAIPLSSRPIVKSTSHPKFAVGTRRPRHNDRELPNGISMHGHSSSEVNNIPC